MNKENQTSDDPEIEESEPPVAKQPQSVLQGLTKDDPIVEFIENNYPDTTIEKKINFVYLITNLIDGKQYIGDHSCNNLEKDYYLGI